MWHICSTWHVCSTQQQQYVASRYVCMCTSVLHIIKPLVSKQTHHSSFSLLLLCYSLHPTPLLSTPTPSLAIHHANYPELNFFQNTNRSTLNEINSKERGAMPCLSLPRAGVHRNYYPEILLTAMKKCIFPVIIVGSNIGILKKRRHECNNRFPFRKHPRPSNQD